MSSSNFLDEHLIMNIVSRLPVESVLQCRCVCKCWRSLLHELYFTQMHTDRTLLHQQQQQQQQQQRRQTVSFFMFVKIPNTKNYEFHLQDPYCYVKYAGDGDGDGAPSSSSSSSSSSRKVIISSRPPLNEAILLLIADDEGKRTRTRKRKGNSFVKWLVIGSVNGLICFYGYKFSDRCNLAPSVSIYNPITREYLNLLPSLGMKDDVGMAIGFGYHPSTNEYKIVRILHRVTGSGNYCVRWVQIYTLGGSGKWRVRKEMEVGQTSFSGTGVYVNRAIYWLDALDKIVSFDLEDEMFRMIPTPTGCIGYELGDLAGEGLCAIERSNVSTNIYIMSNNNNDEDRKYSWSKKFSIPVMAASQYKPIALTRRGRVLCLCNKRSLISFDPSTETIESLGDIPWLEGWSPIVSYTKSFVSLKSLGEEDAQIIERRAAKKKRTNTERRRRRRRRSIDMKTEMIKLFTSLLQNWIILAVGFSTLIIGTLANSKSRSSCGISHNRFLSIRGILCFVHGLFCVSYYISANAATEEAKKSHNGGV